MKELTIKDFFEEEWRDIAGFEGLYRVSNYGRVKSLERVVVVTRKSGKTLECPLPEKILKQDVGNSNAYRVTLSKDGNTKRYLVHRLVATAFIDNPLNKPQVNHKDGNRLNNLYINLEWVTGSENMIHAYKNGLQVPIREKNHYKCKLSDEDVRFIRENYIPRHPEFGGKALSERFGVGMGYLRKIAYGQYRR